MRIVRKDKKKKGFTLIELVAVVAIIGILAAILVPKIAGYMNEAKKTKVIDQARKVLLAVETYNMKHDTPFAGTKVDDVVKNPSIREFILPGSADDTAAMGALDKLTRGMTLTQCTDVVENRRDFKIDGNGVITAVIGTGSNNGDSAVATQ